MGQYYKAFLEDVKENDMKSFYSWDYGAGLKLMEHSYLDNTYLRAVEQTILNNSSRVVWVGDYAPDVFDQSGQLTLSHNEFMRIYKFCWTDDGKEGNFNVKIDVGEFDEYCKFYENKYLINHTRHEFIDYTNYISQYILKDRYIPNPLSLLTNIGNGQGGGDYWGSFNDYVMNAGYWTYDELEISSNYPEKYTELNVYF